MNWGLECVANFRGRIRLSMASKVRRQTEVVALLVWILLTLLRQVKGRERRGRGSVALTLRHSDAGSGKVILLASIHGVSGQMVLLQHSKGIGRLL